MSSTTCTSLPQLGKVHTIAGTTQRSRAQVHPPTTPCAVDALLQYSTRVLTSCVLHREQWRTGTATVGVERRVVSDNAATDSGRWRSARSDNAGRGESWRRVSGQVQPLVVGETGGNNDVMAEERLFGDIALSNCAGGRFVSACQAVLLLLVVVVEERGVRTVL